MRDATDYAACYTSLEDSARSALHRRSDVFDTVMRGFSRFVDESSELLGFDLLFVLAWGLLIVAATKFVEFAVRHVWRLIKWLVASEVIIEPKPGTVSSYVVSWIESQALVGGSSILAEQLVSDENSTDKDEARFNHTAGAVPVRELTKAKYTIAGLAFFVYRRRLFWYKPLEDSESGSSGLANKRAVISCLGFSVEPIKAFVANAALVYRKAQTPRTQILRPGIVLWRLVATQCARPVDTVILGQTDKVNVLTDIHMYLQPFAAEWYSDHGIPYNRGYLFCGPPGTGKYSLALAIAGHFSLNFCHLSFRDPFLTAERLGTLLHKLPPSSVVLLADVDAVSTRAAAKPAAASADDAGPDDLQTGTADGDDGPITLPGLLRALSDVAAREGHVLIFTSERAEHVPPALFRPGMIDWHLDFTLATHDQMRRLFLHMYHPGPKRESGEFGPELLPAMRREQAARAKLLSTQFAKALPADTYSPAQIQEYLLQHTSDPEAAVAGVKRPKEEAREARPDGAPTLPSWRGNLQKGVVTPVRLDGKAYWLSGMETQPGKKGTQPHKKEIQLGEKDIQLNRQKVLLDGKQCWLSENVSQSGTEGTQSSEKSVQPDEKRDWSNGMEIELGEGVFDPEEKKNRPDEKEA